jgi:transcription elongation factor Elf1
LDKPKEQWTWIVNCPACLKVKSLTREDFHGKAKIILKCEACGFEKELENPEPQRPED